MRRVLVSSTEESTVLRIHESSTRRTRSANDFEMHEDPYDEDVVLKAAIGGVDVRVLNRNFRKAL